MLSYLISFTDHVATPPCQIWHCDIFLFKCAASDWLEITQGTNSGKRNNQELRETIVSNRTQEDESSYSLSRKEFIFTKIVRFHSGSKTRPITNKSEPAQDKSGERDSHLSRNNVPFPVPRSSPFCSSRPLRQQTTSATLSLALFPPPPRKGASQGGRRSPCH